MITLITGASHTGKTLLAQKLLEARRTTVLSMDLLKMGLIRSGTAALSPEDDAGVEAVLWPIVVGMIRTAIENRRDLIVEGGYVPGNWAEAFTAAERRQIEVRVLVMSDDYVREAFPGIKSEASAAEDRGDDGWATLEFLLEDNARFRRAFPAAEVIASEADWVRLTSVGL